MSHRSNEDADWARLEAVLGDRFLRVESPLQPCVADPSGRACSTALDLHRNPFFLEEQPGSFQTTGWHDAFDARSSSYAVAARSTADLAAGVTFCREESVPLVVKGTGHDYCGRSSASEALSIWTHHLRDVVVHDSFVVDDQQRDERVPAVTVGAGTRWLEVYQALAGTGRFVLGGGCTSVGAAGGFTQGGGYGSYSRRFGTAAGNVLEMEVVTADGEIVTTNPNEHPDLFWALRGGGGGTFGVVAEVTFRTHPLPERIGAVAGTISAASDRHYRDLVGAIVDLLPAMTDRHWGEQIRFRPDNVVELLLTTVELGDGRARALWAPLLEWVDARPHAFSSEVLIASGPFDRYWDPKWWNELAPEMICRDQRSEATSHLFWWSSNREEASQYVNAYRSRWLPSRAVDESSSAVADALYEASRWSSFGIHLNKGLAGAAPDAEARDRTTSINPVVFESTGLIIVASLQHGVFPGVPGHLPDPEAAAEGAAAVDRAMDLLRSATPDSGTYVNEADYFEPEWQDSFWGTHYERLVEVKARYDPTNLFRVHHGVGSEG